MTSVQRYVEYLMFVRYFRWKLNICFSHALYRSFMLCFLIGVFVSAFLFNHVRISVRAVMCAKTIFYSYLPVRCVLTFNLLCCNNTS